MSLSRHALSAMFTSESFYWNRNKVLSKKVIDEFYANIQKFHLKAVLVLFADKQKKMDSNSRQYIVIGGGYVKQSPIAPKYRAILPKQPGVPRILEQQPLTTANFKLLTYNLQPTPPADLEADISVDQRLQDTNMVQTKTQSTGTFKVISLLKSLQCECLPPEPHVLL